MEPALIWILVGLLLLGAETLLPGVFLLWVGLAAIGAGIMLLLVTPPFWVTVTVFTLRAPGCCVGRCADDGGGAGRDPWIR